MRLLAVEYACVFGVGLNYVSHIAETGGNTPERPMLFMKPSSAILGPGEQVAYPREGETRGVMGCMARRVAPTDAPPVSSATLAPTTSRSGSSRSRRWTRGCLLIGKAFDTFCPLGPVIATGLDPTDLLLEAHINGEQRQSIRTSDLLFPVAELVSYLSQAITLRPGDVILTGMPSGVGPIAPGDEMEGVGMPTR